MAIDVKKLTVDALLELLETKSLAKITIGDIQEKTGISRQTFYKYFRDKQDLIQYIYKTKILSKFKAPDDYNYNFSDDFDSEFDFGDSLIACFEADNKYRKFMKQAIQLNGQNNLRDYMIRHSEEFDCMWLEQMCGKPLTDFQRAVSKYHSNANIQTRINWILTDSPLTPKEKALFLIRLRTISVDGVMADASSEKGPWQKVVERLEFMD
ncbi:MAG: TetR/AcrR family transcriptional regulator [Oscillospiraceae bacterium]|nr:TetR/AcrR family transcriptional regulator [Oscillospiraceae bacterium]